MSEVQNLRSTSPPLEGATPPVNICLVGHMSRGHSRILHNLTHTCVIIVVSRHPFSLPALEKLLTQHSLGEWSGYFEAIQPHWLDISGHHLRIPPQDTTCVYRNITMLISVQKSSTRKSGGGGGGEVRGLERKPSPAIAHI